MKRHILIISKDDSIGRTVKANTMNDFTEVSYGRTSIQVLEMIVQETYSLLIFDTLIRDMDGRSFLQIIRKLSYAPILVLTKKLKIQDRIKLLNIGADDCLVWPADTDELIVRMEACMKRSIERLDIKPVHHKKPELFIDPGRRTVEIKCREIVLTKRVFSKEQIYAAIWGGKFVKDDSNIMSHIGRLRKKIGPEAGKYIQTV